MTYPFRLLALSLALLSAGAPAYAQSSEGDPAPTGREAMPLWVALAAGPSATGGVSAGMSVNAQRGPTVLTMRVAETQTGRSGFNNFIFGPIYNSAIEFSLLAGRARPLAGRWQAVGSVGLSAVRTYRQVPIACGHPISCFFKSSEREASSVLLGVPVEVGLNGPVLGALGGGVRAFANMNAGEPFGGVALELRLGPLR